MTSSDKNPIALVTGGSSGLGRELVLSLAARGWTVVTDGRRADRLAELADPGIVSIPGDLTDTAHRAELRAELTGLGRLDLLVHNAGTLGPSPLPRLETITPDQLQQTWRTGGEGSSQPRSRTIRSHFDPTRRNPCGPRLAKL